MIHDDVSSRDERVTLASSSHNIFNIDRESPQTMPLGDQLLMSNELESFVHPNEPNYHARPGSASQSNRNRRHKLRNKVGGMENMQIFYSTPYTKYWMSLWFRVLYLAFFAFLVRPIAKCQRTQNRVEGPTTRLWRC